jgi:hypothetical protein
MGRILFNNIDYTEDGSIHVTANNMIWRNNGTVMYNGTEYDVLGIQTTPRQFTRITSDGSTRSTVSGDIRVTST